MLLPYNCTADLAYSSEVHATTRCIIYFALPVVCEISLVNIFISNIFLLIREISLSTREVFILRLQKARLTFWEKL